jgi:hypothetical protein
MKSQCPFSIGDLVRFTPSRRTKGLYQDIGRFGLMPNETAVVREIREGIYLYFDEGRGGFPWNEFTRVDKETGTAQAMGSKPYC